MFEDIVSEDIVIDEDEGLDTAQDAEDVEINVDTEESDGDPDDDYESADADDDFEYDDEGNIVVSDDGSEDSEEDEEEEEENDADPDVEEDGTGESEEESPKDTVGVPDERDTRIAQLERKLAAIEAQGKETLSKLGVKDTDDVLSGLESLAAEADGISHEDYIKQRSEQKRRDDAEALLRATEFEKKARADLSELQRYYPETRDLTDIRKLPPEVLKKFGQYRDLGLPPKEAYAAANPDGIRQSVATAVKSSNTANTKEHLRSAVPKSSKDNSVHMTRAELEQWRDLFPKLSDKEIAKRYRDAHK